MERENKKLNTVHERDLDNLLNKFGLLQKFKDNQLKCKFCGEIVNEENIYSIFPEGNNVNMVCDKLKCSTDFFQYLEERRKLITKNE